MNFEGKSVGAIYAFGGHDARENCIHMVMQGTKNPVQTDTLKALQQDRRRIAMLIAGDSKDLRALVDSYTMASEDGKP